MEDTITLPVGVHLQLLAEGAANIVYRIVLPGPNQDPPTQSDLSFAIPADGSSTPPPTEVDLPTIDAPDSRLERKLLRLRKALPWTSPIATLHKDIHATMFPLFDTSQLVAHHLALLPPGLIAECNAQLRATEQGGTRPQKRHGVYLEEDEPYGLLVTDMTPDAANNELTFEVKPKWLAQSPTAPRDAKRCRTCALRERRQAKARSESKRPEEGKDFCPLDLGSGEKDGVQRAVAALFGNSKSFSSEPQSDAMQSRLTDFFISTRILPRLAELQSELDPAGVLNTSQVTRQVCIAMTLRDCTLFLKIPSNREGPIEARLGDLDIKNADAGKLEYWQSLERQLIEEGWYSGTEVEALLSVCRLSR